MEGSVSRDEAIAVVEAYLNGLAKKNLTNVPFAADITFEGPRVPKLIGRESVVGFLTSIMPLVTRLEIKQHLVDGEFVATMFDMETVHGTDKVVDWLRVSGGQLKEVRSFYYPKVAS
jgi:SnoaL-like domain